MNFVCDKGRTRMLVQVPKTLVAGHRRSVSYRIDDKPPVKNSSWLESDDHSAVIVQDKARAIKFAKELYGAKSLLFRIEDGNFGMTEMTFSIAGLEQAITPLRTACKW